jgi:hypothetical protein
MTCHLIIRPKWIVAFMLFAMPAVATAQQAPTDLAPATHWQQWIERQKRLPVGAWAYDDALNDDSLLARYTAAGFTIVPKAHWTQGAVLPTDCSAALDLGLSADRSADGMKQLISSGPPPALVLLGQELTPDQFKATGAQADAINIASGGAALPLNSLLPNWYVYFDRLNITYEQYVEQFIAQAKPEALMAVELPLMADGTDRTFYYDELAVLRRESMEHGIGLFGIVQAVGHGPRYRQPSASDLRWQVYSYLAYGAKGLWYYFFSGNGIDDGLTTGLAWYPTQLGPADPPRGFGVEQTPAAKSALDNIRQINNEVAAMSPTLLKLRSTGVYHIGKEPPPGVDLIRDDSASPFAGFTGEDFLVGDFCRSDKSAGEDYVLIVNERHGPAAQASYESSISFTLRQPFSSVDVIDAASGNPHRLSAGQAGYTLHLPGGEGVLLHCH